MFTFAEKLKQMSNIEHKDVGVSSLKGTPSKKIYIKTSTEAVYNPEGVTQEYINNHVDGSKIVDGTITNNKIADSTISMGKLDNDVQTKIQQGTQRAWNPRGAYNENTVYGVNDLVYHTDTNSSYISLQANNQGHNPAWQSATGGWWMKVIDGSYVNVMVDELEQAIAQAIEDAQEDISGLISDSQATINAAVSGANTAAQAANTAAANAEAKIDWVEEQVNSLTAYEVDDKLDETSIIPVQNKVVSKEINNANSYLYGDLRTLAVGQTYYLGESIKTENKQLLKVTKEILKMNNLDEVSIGDIRVVTSGTYLGTYQALKNVKTYTDTSYAENDYAIGRPAGAVINVVVDSETITSLEEATLITVTIAGIEFTVTVDSTMDAVGVATAIFTAFGTQEEWRLIDNSDGTLTLISKVAKTSAPTISSSVGDTGITISFAENSAYAGSTKLSKYNGTTWEAISLDNYAADTAMWANRDATWLSTISNGVVQQNSAQNEFNAREGTSEYWDFAISDKKGNVICIIKDGHIITKNFKSSDLRISVGDVTNAAYAVSDVNGNMAFAITEDGHIVTKNFNSRLVSLESIALLDKIITLVTKFIGKTMAVVGDSISTYTGYTPSNWRVYYPSGNVNNVSLTFWHIVATTLGMTALNCAYSASSVTGDSTQTEVSSSHAGGECAGCSDVRIASLTRDGNTPDIVLITLGTNDYGNGRALGSWDEHSAIPSEGTISNFSSAYALMLHKIKTVLPNARIFCCTIFQRSFGFPTGTLSIRSYNDVIKNMADIFGCDVIDTYACGLNRYNIGSYSVDGTLHPNAAGHKLIAEKIITELIAKY